VNGSVELFAAAGDAAGVLGEVEDFGVVVLSGVAGLEDVDGPVPFEGVGAAVVVVVVVGGVGVWL
jgi:hypothetical protein